MKKSQVQKQNPNTFQEETTLETTSSSATAIPQKQKKEEKLITAASAATLLGISSPTFLGMVRAGQVKFTTLNKRRKFRQSDIESLL